MREGVRKKTNFKDGGAGRFSEFRSGASIPKGVILQEDDQHYDIAHSPENLALIAEIEAREKRKRAERLKPE